MASGVSSRASLWATRRTAGLLSERRDDFPRAVYPDGRPQDRQIKAGVTVFDEALAAARHRPQQADCVEQAIAKRLAADTLLCFIGLCGEATRTYQTLKEWQSGEESRLARAALRKASISSPT